MPIVTMPDGTQVTFPDDMPADDIRTLIGQKFPDAVAAPAPKPPSAYEDALSRWNATYKARTPQVGSMEALGRGVFAGATANFADELAGLGEASGLPRQLPAGGAFPQLFYQGARNAAGAGRLAYEAMTEPGEATKRYEAQVAAERARNALAKEQHPVLFTTGEIGGAVALPTGRVLAPVSVARRALNAGAMGGLYGAAAGAGEGTTLAERGTGAAVGGAVGTTLGALASPVTELAARAVRPVAQRITGAFRSARNPEDQASVAVVDAMRRDAQADPNFAQRLDLQEFADAQARGQPVRNVDLGGATTRQLADVAGISSPEARSVLETNIDQVYRSQGPRVGAWLQQAAHFPDAPAQARALRQTARNVNNAAYTRAMDDPAAQSLWDEGFQQLTAAPVVQDAIRGATRTGRNQAAAEGFRPPVNPFEFAADGSMTMRPGVTPSLRFWDMVKRNLDDVVDTQLRQGERAAARDTIALRDYLVQHLDDLVPSYQTARQGAAHFFRADNALDAGRNFVMGRQDMSIDGARQALNRMSATERQLFSDGFVSEFLEKIAKTGDSRNILNLINQSPDARQRMVMALGQQRAHELEAVLRVENIIDRTRTTVTGNSRTAQRAVAAGLIGGGSAAAGTVAAGDFNPEHFSLAGAGGAATSVLANALMSRGKRVDARVAHRVAELLMSDEPQRLLAGAQIIARSNTLMNGLREFDRRIGTAGAGQAVPSASSAVQTIQNVRPAGAEEDDRAGGR